MIKSLLAAVALTLLTGAAQATTLTGSQLSTNPNITLPNGNGTNVGSSVQFGGPPTNQIMVSADLTGLGVGTSGTIIIDTTRITDDSDFWIGLHDGTNFDATGFWDGNRFGNYSGTSSSDGLTFSEGAINDSTPLTSPIGIGAQGVITYTFDLLAGTSSLEVNGTSVARALFPELDTSAPLSFLIGKGSTSEVLQINSITFPGTVAAVPLPAGLPLLLGAFLALAFFRRRRESIA